MPAAPTRAAPSARTQDLPYIFALCAAKGFRERLEKTLDLDETYDKFLAEGGGADEDPHRRLVHPAAGSGRRTSRSS